MKKTKILSFGLMLLISFAHPLSAQTSNKQSPVQCLEMDTEKSILQFAVSSFFSNVRGRFDYWTGSIDFDPKEPLRSKVTIKIQAKTINTDNRTRDKHLRSEDFFWTEKFPEITFESVSITPVEA